MYLVRDIFIAKPGHAKQLVQIFKATSPYFLSKGAKNVRILTDVVSDFWKVIWEFELEEIEDYFKMSSAVDSDIDVFTELQGYKEHVVNGHREIFKIN
ncbi:hypothetical protein [Reichenbachiella sp.]|uniref:hypothetical protein n=1 Tax=Reichenbachiella sp. TaxID=2184521 RepID=UPI00329A72CE